MSVHEPCPECGAADMVVHIQRVSEGRFRCSTSDACDACGCRSEADGDELGPDVRALVLREHGVWRAVLVEAAPRRLELLRLLIEQAVLARSAAGALPARPRPYARG